jgi:hypothetical protein
VKYWNGIREGVKESKVYRVEGVLKNCEECVESQVDADCSRQTGILGFTPSTYVCS